MASAAEERIRVKAEGLFRSLWPEARIVHEFDLGGVRLDLAAITDDRLILGEIKSENDTLTRLPRQMEGASHIGGLAFLFCAERWVPHVQGSRRAINMVEDGDGFTCFIGTSYRYPLNEHLIAPEHEAYNSRALLGLLLKPELLALARSFGGKAKHDVPTLARLAHDGLTGLEVRRSVMAALRARNFGWTCDAPAKAPAPTEGVGETPHPEGGRA